MSARSFAKCGAREPISRAAPTALPCGPATVYRIQDADGRGPYRPGFSVYRSDDVGPHNPTIFEDFGADVARLFKRGWHYGCAFRSPQQAGDWFTIREAMRLAGYGFALVRIDAEIVAASERQLIVRRKLALHRKATSVAWTEMFQRFPA